MESCEHINQIKIVEPNGEGCEECLQIGSWWVHLRLCLTCGHVGCCDSSPNRHATKHAEKTSHHVVKSLEADENWVYCYADETFIEEFFEEPKK
ncbi:MAG: UBP-type zinc finger domain-containing protein [Chloroflexota bacterium]